MVSLPNGRDPGKTSRSSHPPRASCVARKLNGHRAMAGNSAVSKAALYAKRAALGMFAAQFVSSLLDVSPFAPLTGTTGGLRILGAAFLAALLAVPAAAVGAFVGYLASNAEATSGQPAIQSSGSDAGFQSEPSASLCTPSAPNPSKLDRALNHKSTAALVALSAPTEAQWEASLAEFEGKGRRPGLWARVYAESRGDEPQAKAAYLRIRAQEMMEESQMVVAAQIAEAMRLRAEHERDNPELAKLRLLQESLSEIDENRHGVEPMVKLTHLLGGNAERKSAGHMGRVWFTEFEGHAQLLHTNEQFMSWGIEHVVPVAKVYLLQPPSSAAEQ